MQEHNLPHDIDAVYALMMDALDGQLSAEGWDQLDTALIADPQLAAEWEAMRAVDALFIRMPQAQPPVQFAERAMSRLPNWRARRWLVAAAFVAMWSAGLLPVLFIAWLFGAEVSTIATALWQIGGAFFSAMGQLAIGFGGTLTRYPAAMGALLVMVGSITLWSGVYQRLMMQSVPAAQ